MENQVEQAGDNTKQPQTGLKLTVRQTKALPYFLESASIHEVCRRANIGQSTFYRYMANDNFRAALEEARKQVTSSALMILKESFSKAAKTLVSLLDNPQVWVKLRASERILETVLQLREVEEIQGRLEEVEKIIVEKRLYR
jgi:hypothetical protein